MARRAGAFGKDSVRSALHGSVINVINCRWGTDRAAYNVVGDAYNFFNGSTVRVEGGNLYLGNAGIYRNNTFVADRIIIHENAVEGLTAPGGLSNVFIGNVEIARVNQIYREVVELRECTTNLVRTTTTGWNFEEFDEAGGARPDGLLGTADLQAVLHDDDFTDPAQDCARLLARNDYEHFSAVQTEQGAQDNRMANRGDFQRFNDHLARCEDEMRRQAAIAGAGEMVTALLDCAREGNENGPLNTDSDGPGGNATEPDPDTDGQFPGQNTQAGDWSIGSGLGVGAVKDELEKARPAPAPRSSRHHRHTDAPPGRLHHLRCRRAGRLKLQGPGVGLPRTRCALFGLRRHGEVGHRP